MFVDAGRKIGFFILSGSEKNKLFSISICNLSRRRVSRTRKERDEMSQRKERKFVVDVSRGGGGVSEIINEAMKNIMREQEEFPAK